MRGAYLGPAYDDKDCQRMARRTGAPNTLYEDDQALYSAVAPAAGQGQRGGLVPGPHGVRPRAPLGNRSILGDPRNPTMQRKLNLKIKYREGFRPFAPSVMEEELADWFDLDHASPYMLLVAPRWPRPGAGSCPRATRACPCTIGSTSPGPRFPAVTHVDNSARIQSVGKNTNFRYWSLLDTFRREQGCPVLVNTSFNVRGEPIVCTPEDAYACFMRTEMDYLVIGNRLFAKEDQPEWRERGSWRDQYGLD